jgi:hypothetical protein
MVIRKILNALGVIIVFGVPRGFVFAEIKPPIICDCRLMREIEQNQEKYYRTETMLL